MYEGERLSSLRSVKMRFLFRRRGFELRQQTMQRTGNPVSRTQREARTEKGINIYNHKNLAERSSAATAQWQSTTPPKRKTISQCLLYGQLELKPSFGLNFNLLRLRSSSFIFSCCRRQDTEKTHKHTTQKTEDRRHCRQKRQSRRKTEDKRRSLRRSRNLFSTRYSGCLCCFSHYLPFVRSTRHSPQPPPTLFLPLSPLERTSYLFVYATCKK